MHFEGASSAAFQIDSFAPPGARKTLIKKGNELQVRTGLTMNESGDAPKVVPTPKIENGISDA